MSYEYTYDLQDGQVSYVQVLPFQWYRFDDTPDIGMYIRIHEKILILFPPSLFLNCVI